MKVRQLIELAITYLRSGWCTGNFAQDSGGNCVSFASNQASSFCIYGAMRKAATFFDDVTFERAYDLVKVQVSPFPMNWNDNSDQATVIKALEGINYGG